MSGPKSRHLRTWKKRYFVFDRKEKVLSYFQEKSSTKHKGFSYFEVIFTFIFVKKSSALEFNDQHLNNYRKYKMYMSTI